MSKKVSSTHRSIVTAIASSFVALVGLAACSSESEPAEITHVAYEGCTLGSADVVCADGLACIPTDAAPKTTGFCSESCAVANDCPDDADGRTKICEQPEGASAKLCYVTCPSASSTCPDGMVCLPTKSSMGTALSICVPRD
jgi:hypothetical protein